MVRSKNTVYISVMLSQQEKDRLDAAAAKAEITRNRLIRDWILSLEEE